MDNNVDEGLVKLLTAVHCLMEDSLKAYSSYQQNGRTYRYAKELRRCNSSMIDLLSGNADLLNEELKNASAVLIEHYTIWRNKWDVLEKKLCPDLDDEFVFQNEHTFPKAAALLLEKTYLDSGGK